MLFEHCCEKSDVRGRSTWPIPSMADSVPGDVTSVLLRPADGRCVAVQNKVATKGRGIMAMDESNATCGLRLASIGLENTEANRQAYRQLLVSTPGLGEYISGAILFEETLYQDTTDGKKMIDVLAENGIIPGIKVDKVP